MSLTAQQLIDGYGAAVATGNGALFVGSGLSLARGYPSWEDLLRRPREKADIPEELRDLPLVAEYFVQAISGGRDWLNNHILTEIAGCEADPGPGHKLVAELPVDEIWTTNYDDLLERSMPEAHVVTHDKDLSDRRTSWSRRVIKMHGSIDPGPPVGWKRLPVVTRSDYESYESKNPRLSAALNSVFLTRAILFLGFSFADPNIDVLLRLARTRLALGGPEHFTVLRVPEDDVQIRLHRHRVRDFEESGVGVYEVASFEELDPLLGLLVRRTRPPRLFVAGSDTGEDEFAEICTLLGNVLASEPLTLVSLAGAAALDVSYSFGEALRAEGRYSPDRIVLMFRPKHGEPPPRVPRRMGTIVYAEEEKEALRRHAIDSCRALVVVGGGANTKEEAKLAIELGVPVVPLAASGGTARVVWEQARASLPSIEFGGHAVNAKDFDLLAQSNVHVAVASVLRLVRQAMYLNESVSEGR